MRNATTTTPANRTVAFTVVSDDEARITFRDSAGRSEPCRPDVVYHVSEIEALRRLLLLQGPIHVVVSQNYGGDPRAIPIAVSASRDDVDKFVQTVTREEIIAWDAQLPGDQIPANPATLDVFTLSPDGPAQVDWDARVFADDPLTVEYVRPPFDSEDDGKRRLTLKGDAAVVSGHPACEGFAYALPPSTEGKRALAQLILRYLGEQ